jgi:hypothetical protein
MTTNQIAYWNLQETMRSNKAREDETNRHNLASEGLTSTELGIKRDTLTENSRHNVQSEEDSRRNTDVTAIGRIFSGTGTKGVSGLTDAIATGLGLGAGSKIVSGVKGSKTVSDVEKELFKDTSAAGTATFADKLQKTSIGQLLALMPVLLQLRAQHDYNHDGTISSDELAGKTGGIVDTGRMS